MDGWLVSDGRICWVCATRRQHKQLSAVAAIDSVTAWLRADGDPLNASHTHRSEQHARRWSPVQGACVRVCV